MTIPGRRAACESAGMPTGVSLSITFADHDRHLALVRDDNNAPQKHIRRARSSSVDGRGSRHERDHSRDPQGQDLRLAPSKRFAQKGLRGSSGRQMRPSRIANSIPRSPARGRPDLRKAAGRDPHWTGPASAEVPASASVRSSASGALTSCNPTTFASSSCLRNSDWSTSCATSSVSTLSDRRRAVSCPWTKKAKPGWQSGHSNSSCCLRRIYGE
jgi:hypothetical protein